MKTIAKNRTALIDRILNTARDFRCYSLDNGFRGELMDGRAGNIMAPADWMRKELREFSFAHLHSNGNGHYTVHVHSNLWFEFDSDVQ